MALFMRTFVRKPKHKSSNDACQTFEGMAGYDDHQNTIWLGIKSVYLVSRPRQTEARNETKLTTHKSATSNHNISDEPSCPTVDLP
jgi:hypothetical protein